MKTEKHRKALVQVESPSLSRFNQITWYNPHSSVLAASFHTRTYWRRRCLTLIHFARRRMRRFQWNALKASESNDAASQVSARIEHWMREISRKRESEYSAKLAREFIAAGTIEYLSDRIVHQIDADGKLRINAHQENIRTCIRTLAAFCLRDNGAHLAEAIRRDSLEQSCVHF